MRIGGEVRAQLATRFEVLLPHLAEVQQERHARVPQVVKAHRSEAGRIAQRVPAAAQVGRLNRCSGPGGEHVPGVQPREPRCGTLGVLTRRRMPSGRSSGTPT
jgi:hypothetical protein